MARLRCETGNFFIRADQFDNQVLSSLEKDEIIKYDPQQNGYFITHDIYEEWALDKIIETEFVSLTTYQEFFNKIGNSLAIRRSFRIWLSEKLESNTTGIKSFLESAFVDEAIPIFWKDEMLVSILLSEYSESFFDIFGKLLLDNSKQYLKKVIFLLRIACKEVDNTIIDKIAASGQFDIDPTFLFTKPKGRGWQTTIKFIYTKIDSFDAKNLTFILPLLDEWTSHEKRGEATRFSALFALKFYRESQLNSTDYYGEETEKILIRILLNGTSEVNLELIDLLNEILKNDLQGRGPYNDLRDNILSSSFENTPLIVSLPEFVIKIADKFWHQPKAARNIFEDGDIGVEQHYLIPFQWQHEYFPASAYQTPIYRLLQVSFAKTVDFIIHFTNRAIQSYALSGFDPSVKEIEFVIDENTITKQYISSGIWNTYRGNSGPVVPYLLQSIHMALEKQLFQLCKKTDKKTIEKWLLYLLKNTRTASITAVVTSVVLAFPDDFFQVAKILFSNIEFLPYDNLRKFSEHEAKGIYSLGGFDNRSKIYDDERLSTCLEPHRGMSLEDLALKYQFFKNESVTEDELEKRQETIWAIIDEHYAKIPPGESQTEYYLDLKLLLTRMDRRKMNPTLEQTEDSIILRFNPELDPELKNLTENAAKDSLEFTKYLALKLWAINKFETRKFNGKYPQYEDNPDLILKETREIIDKLKEGDNLFVMTNHATPAFSSYVLIKDFSDRLSSEDLVYCKEIVLEYAGAPLRESYQYQISDGVEVAIHALPYLYKLFPEEKSRFNYILLLILFDAQPIGEYKRICDYSIESINSSLYQISPDDPLIILTGYLVLKDKFNKFYQLSQSKKHEQPGHRISRSNVIKQFSIEQAGLFDKMASNQLKLEDIKIEQLELETLETAFQLISVETIDPLLLDFAKQALPSLFTAILKVDDSPKYGRSKDYKIRFRFLRRYSYFILHREITTIKDYLEPLMSRFTVSKEIADLLQELIIAEDSLHTYDTFWVIWENLYEAVKNVALTSRSRDLAPIIHNYFLAFPYWNKNSRQWASLKEREKLFFSKASKEMGKNPAVLYAIAKFLNEIGSDFLNEGIIWISNLLSNNESLNYMPLETNTIYYLEKLVRKFVYVNRTKLRAERILKNHILVILNFLSQKGSVSGYLLREDIL